MPMLGYSAGMDSPIIRALQDELLRERTRQTAIPLSDPKRQLELEAKIGDELRRIGSDEAKRYPATDRSAAALYLGQHFPQYAKQFPGVSQQTVRDLLERGIGTPAFSGPVRFGAGSYMAQPREPQMRESNYIPQQYYPRMVASGPSAPTAVAPTPQAVPARATLPIGEIAQPGQSSYIWMGGPEGQPDYERWKESYRPYTD